MISSEAQRTLVKSPPELWAEISDPESLARHLGEFGEIRITRVQPEQKVEWEGDRASGTVVIKPSGWGTKVKLTVTRELAPDADDVAAREDGDGADTALAAAPPDPERAPDIATAAESEREPPPASASHTEAAPVAESAPQTESAPELESAPNAQAAPEPEAAPEPAAEQSPSAVEIDLSSEPKAAVTDAPASAIEPESQPGPTERAEQVSEPVARRGFFARLFARRRGAVSQPSAAPTPELDRDDGQGPISEARVAEEPVAEEPVAEEPVAEEPVAEEPVSDEPVAKAPVVDEPVAETPNDDEPANDEPPVFEPAGFERDFDEPPADAADGPQGGLAGELAAAGEITAEQVQAVLTGVLDRLGAAHHRPFSRS